MQELFSDPYINLPQFNGPQIPEIIKLSSAWVEKVAALEFISCETPWSASVIKQEFSRDVSHRYGLVIDDTLIGHSFNHIVCDELHVLNLAVHPSYRGFGYGEKLLRHVMAEARALQVREASLEVRASNKVAQSLYEKLGFKLIAIRKNYYRSNGEDALVMALEIKG